ncbi:MAG: hypothetical protein DRI57_07600 [Deltaproteobacteria bacterium]|nr:MAG: hypothetical protein DRI57_07600 [Deltaproteobacteria bacterium]
MGVIGKRHRFIINLTCCKRHKLSPVSFFHYFASDSLRICSDMGASAEIFLICGSGVREHLVCVPGPMSGSGLKTADPTF